MSLYFGTFLIAFATLALEVILTRLLSVCTWYHLAFFAISCAMMGMTAGAITVFVKPKLFPKENIAPALGWACFAFAVSVPVTLLIICRVPLPQELVILSPQFLSVLLITLGCALPFYFSGIAVTGVLTKSSLSISKLYGCDLVGAALGCLGVLGGLEFFSAPHVLLLSALTGFVAGISFIWKSKKPDPVVTKTKAFIVLCVFLVVAISATWRVEPSFIKGKYEDVRNYFRKRWNSFSFVAIEQAKLKQPSFWAKSPAAPELPERYQYQMVIDGCAGTTVSGFSNLQDIEYLAFDVTNAAHFVVPRGNVAVIGFGGGRDIQSALLFGHSHVTGIDVNPVFIEMQQKEFKGFAGLAANPQVDLVADEGRSYLSKTPERFRLIQMSLIDTWAATGAGAFSLTENGLYTVEAWKIFYDRLEDDGIFTVARYYNPFVPAETARLLSLAVATLLEKGVQSPAQHIAIVSCNNVATLLLNKRPFSSEQAAQLRQVCLRLGYIQVVMPDVLPGDQFLAAVASSRSLGELQKLGRLTPFNTEPSTDEKPYFFNMLNLRMLFVPILHPGVLQGNMLATATLLELIIAILIMTVLAIIVPLKLSKGQSNFSFKTLWPQALYFSLIGAGFMLLEIGLLQRLSTFLGHPAFALGILLFTIILSTGCGSFASGRMKVPGSWVRFLPFLTAGGIVLLRFFLSFISVALVSSGIFIKIAIAVAMIAPIGFLMGFFFPTGMRLLKDSPYLPWYWGLNGVFGVLFSALAVFFSIYFGISVNFFLAAICYALTSICFSRFQPTGHS